MFSEQVPVAMLPRYTTLSSCVTGSEAGLFTVPMDVTAYDSAVLTVWRGFVIGTQATAPTEQFEIAFQESTDRDSWHECAVSPSATPDPGLNQRQQYVVTLTRRWFRVRVILPFPDNVVTCWATGFLQKRRQ